MTVRDHLIDALRAELIGPYDLHHASTELLRLAPSRSYLTGFIAPPELLAEDEAPTDEDAPREDLDAQDDFAAGSDTEDEEDSAPNPEPASKKIFPASVGLSLLLPPEATHVTARLRWGEYRRVLIDPDTHQEAPPPRDTDPKSKKRLIVAWRRVPVSPPPVELPLTNPLQIARGVHVTGQIWLQGRLADTGQGDGTLALSLFLVNRRVPDESNPREQTILFQIEYELHCPAGILPRPDLTGQDDSADLDDKISDLQYRHCYEYAVGHGAAAIPLFPAAHQPTSTRDDARPAPRAPAVALCWLPRAEFKPVAARKDAPVTVSMEALGKLKSAAEVEAALGGLPRAYEAWIESELVCAHARVDLSASRREILQALIDRARAASARIRAGIDLLARDPQTRLAFTFANRAMFFQARQRARGAGPNKEGPTWRLFQLAFILLCLADIAFPTGHEGARTHREDVELIFFPTGGGKTEAYLGLIAFTLLLRRLRGKNTADGGEGVAVILRYTLRLLTFDQLERASTLICALETMRVREHYRAHLGERRFEIGLWVGGKASPNRMIHLKEQLSAFRAGTGQSPCPLQLCPWCGEALTPKSLTVESTPSGLERAIVRCHNHECDFSKDPHSAAGLPLHFVDEQIYRDLPCFLVATVDKFAMLPWRGETGMLFGRVTHRELQGGCYFGPTTPSSQIPRSAEPLPGLLPPELIVQDELHLISGPLGTMVGLFETAVEELCTREIDGRRIAPKRIAATATVRRAERQVQALYGRRDTHLFPPHGLDPFETWFSLVEHDKPGRVYLGVGAGGRAMKRILLQTYLTVLGAAARAEQNGASIADTDGYFTLVGYFNSLRELGGMRRLVEDDIATRAPKQEEGRPLDAIGPHRWLAKRSVGFPQELTSREKTADIIKVKDRASLAHGGDERALDVLLASNMISVGVDIPRLGVMVVAGQPKTTAEYIQASSRVGRSHQWPGLVITALNLARPRDRSHYEHFTAYHESFYRHVEATSVTPFSAPAIDRGLAAVVVTLTRLLDLDMTPSARAMHAPGIQALSAQILAAIHRKAAQQPTVGEGGEAASDAFARSVQDRAASLIDGWLAMIRGRNDGQHLHYSPYDLHRGRGRPLLRNALDAQRPDPESRLMLSEDEKRFAAPTSMRDIEPSVHVWRRFKLGSNQ